MPDRCSGLDGTAYAIEQCILARMHDLAIVELSHPIASVVVLTEREVRQAKRQPPQQFFRERVCDAPRTQATFDVHDAAARQSACDGTEPGRQGIAVHHTSGADCVRFLTLLTKLRQPSKVPGNHVTSRKTLERSVCCCGRMNSDRISKSSIRSSMDSLCCPVNQTTCCSPDWEARLSTGASLTSCARVPMTKMHSRILRICCRSARLSVPKSSRSER